MHRRRGPRAYALSHPAGLSNQRVSATETLGPVTNANPVLVFMSRELLRGSAPQVKSRPGESNEFEWYNCGLAAALSSLRTSHSSPRP